MYPASKVYTDKSGVFRQSKNTFSLHWGVLFSQGKPVFLLSWTACCVSLIPVALKSVLITEMFLLHRGKHQVTHPICSLSIQTDVPASYLISAGSCTLCLNKGRKTQHLATVAQGKSSLIKQFTGSGLAIPCRSHRWSCFPSPNLISVLNGSWPLKKADQ